MLKYIIGILILLSCNTQETSTSISGNENLLACTEEARLCPDGSSVARNIENQCAFDKCPSENADPDEPTLCSTDVKICNDGSHVSRNPYKNCNFYECSSEDIYCTQEVKSCPDGTFVGRDPSNGCAFLLCEEDVDL